MLLGRRGMEWPRSRLFLGAMRMKSRIGIAVVLAILAAVAFTGCAYDPFYRCDNRRSLADWFDEYGPLGCSCYHGNGNCSTCRNCNCQR